MKKLATALVAGAMALVLVACGTAAPGGSAGGGAAGNTTLVIGAPAAVSGNFSPIHATSAYDMWVVNMVFDSVYEYDENNQLAPILATGPWEVSEDGLTYTITLRDDVVFSNGNPLTAQDVVFTYSAIADPSYVGQNLTSVQFIEGFEEMRSGEADTLSGLQVIDEHTFSITFTEVRRDNSLIFIINIMDQETFPDYVVGDTSIFTDAQLDPMGTGPYVLTSWTLETGPVLNRNDSYWGDMSENAPQTIVIREINDQNLVQEFEAGNLDYYPQVITSEQIDWALSTDTMSSVSYPRAGLGYLSFNTAQGATADVAVRQALMFAFDRQGANEVLFNAEEVPEGIAYVPQTFINPVSIVGDVVRGETPVDGLETYEFDLDRANQILDDAGWVRGADGVREKDGERLTVRIMSMPDHSILPTLVAFWDRDWSAIGAEVQVANMDFNAITQIIVDDNQLSEWSVFFLATSFTTDSMSGVRGFFHSDEAQASPEGDLLGANYSRISDPELDALIAQGETTLDDEEAIEVYKQIAVRLNELAPMMPIYGNIFYDIFSADKMEGLTVNSLYDFPRSIRHVNMLR